MSICSEVVSAINITISNDIIHDNVSKTVNF